MVPALYLTALRYSDTGIPPKHVGEVKVFVTQSVMSNSFRPHGLQPTRLLCHGIIQARILEWVAISFSGDLPNPGIQPQSLALQVDSLPSEPIGKVADKNQKHVSLIIQQSYCSYKYYFQPRHEIQRPQTLLKQNIMST